MPPETPPDHVLIVIESDYPSNDGGGAEAQVQLLARHFPPALPAIVVAPLVPYGPQLIDEIVDGTPVHRIWYPRLPLIGAAVMLGRLALHIIGRRQRIRAIHCHIAHNMAAVCCALGWLLGLPVIVKLTGMREFESGILSSNRSLGVRLRRWLIRRASFLQAISRELAAGLACAGFDPARVQRIPNAVDTALFVPDRAAKPALRTRLGIEADFVACFVGRLVPEKALDILLRAWDRAIAKDASAKLVLVGTGPLEGELKRLAHSLGRHDQIVFVGHVAQRSAVAEYWRSSDVGVLPSAFEGLSNALLEAIASGMPMIGSRVSGTTDLITPERNGWLFDPGDVDQLASCLRQAFTMTPAARDRLGDAARQTALAHAGIDQVIGRLRQLYAARRQEGALLCVD